MPTALTPELLALPAVALLAAIIWLALRLRAARRDLTIQARALAAESVARQHASTRAAWLDAALESTTEGVLVADSDLRVVHWNRRFAALSGLPDDMPRAGATLASLLRLSAEAGEFGLIDVDQEVARQSALIAQGPGAFPRLRHRPDGSIIEFTLGTLPGGGLLLRSTDVTTRHRTVAATQPAPPHVATPLPPSAATLPLAVPLAVPLALPLTLPLAPPPPAPPPRPRRCLVLLVEDMQVNQMVTATQLRREGHRVDVASSGAEALRLATLTPYDVVLMDLMMPGMSGYEAARRMRALAGPTGRTPIFALTANTGEQERALCLAAGMQGMMSKPVPVTLLRQALQHSTITPASSLSPASCLPHTASRPPGDALLDAARLAELRRDLPPAILATLCRQCLDDLRDRIIALETALAGDAAAPVEREAHAIAGMASSYGLARIEGQARAILTPSLIGDLATARTAARGLNEAFSQSQSALRAWSE